MKSYLPLYPKQSSQAWTTNGERMIALGHYVLLKPLQTGPRAGSSFIHLDDGLPQYEVESIGSKCDFTYLDVGDIVVVADENLVINVNGRENDLVATIHENILGKV